MISAEDNARSQVHGRLKAFTYLTAEKAPLYRAIMRLFMESRERFVFHLSPRDFIDSFRQSGVEQLPGETEIDSALMQLCEWGNLQTRPDTSDVGTVQDFYRQRHGFQITSQGEAAEQAAALFRTVSEQDRELQPTALPMLEDIRDLLLDLRRLSREAMPDSGSTHRSLLMLQARFENLGAAAEIFIARLERRTRLEPNEARRLIDYCDQFVVQLVLAGDSIADSIRDIEAAGLGRLLQAAAERSVRGSPDVTADGIAGICREWYSQWDRLRNWFVSEAGRPSNSELVRERARASMPALLSAIASVNDRRIHRIDRSNDFRILARWFAQAESDADAHRLWRAAFGLSPARHLVINEATLDDYEAQGALAKTSWVDAPPLRISARLRDYGSNSRTGRLSRLIDRTAEKEKLAAATHEEAIRMLNAQRRFGTGRRMRLSDLEHLEVDEFDLFLDLLGEAVSARVFPAEPVEVLSGDGCLRVKLEPTDDGREALILTSEGIFSGPDHWISIEQISSEEVVM